MTGIIRSLVKDKGFGFITPDDKSNKNEYFFHRSAVKNANWDDLYEQQHVTFEDADGKKGPRAEDVYV